MKVESPLEVLSRAASIVQGEEKPMIDSARVGSGTDSGFEDELVHNKSPQLSPIQQPSSGSPSETIESNNILNRKSHSPKRSLPSPNSMNKKVKLENTTKSTPENTVEVVLHNKQWSTPPPPYVFHHKDLIQNSKTKDNSILPPPLIAMSEQSSYVPKLPTYASFFPRPSVISTSSPASTFNTDHYAKTKSCNCCKVGYCTIFSSEYKNSLNKSKATIPNEFVEQPTVDDHFRKSLGDKYDYSKEQHELNKRPSSVDEHFEKALGKTWYNMEYGRCKSL